MLENLTVFLIVLLVSVIMRHDKPLRSFDPMISDNLLAEMEKSGIQIYKTIEVS